MTNIRPITDFKFTEEEYQLFLNDIEIWRVIEGWKDYQVSTFGRFRSLKRGIPELLKFDNSGHGYLRVTLCGNGKIKKHPAGRLVGLAFIHNPLNKPQINHDDGIKTHNFPNNLFWCTQGENNSHAYATGLAKGTAFGKFGVNSHGKIVTVDQFTLNGIFIKRFYCAKDAARELGVSGRGIYDSASPNSRKKTAYGFIWKYADI